MAKSRAELEKAWAKIIAKAWTDERFKEKLLKNPAQSLKEMGLELPAGQKVEVHEQGYKVVHLILPNKPEGELSETDLKKVAAGVCGSSELNWVEGDWEHFREGSSE